MIRLAHLSDIHFGGENVPATAADVTDLERDVGFRPSTPVREGVRRFVEWYREYYKV